MATLNRLTNVIFRVIVMIIIILLISCPIKSLDITVPHKGPTNKDGDVGSDHR